MVDFGWSLPPGCNELPDEEPVFRDCTEQFQAMHPHLNDEEDLNVLIVCAGYTEERWEVQFRMSYFIWALPDLNAEGGEREEQIIMDYESHPGEWEGDGWRFYFNPGCRIPEEESQWVSIPFPEGADMPDTEEEELVALKALGVLLVATVEKFHNELLQLQRSIQRVLRYE